MLLPLAWSVSLVHDDECHAAPIVSPSAPAGGTSPARRAEGKAVRSSGFIEVHEGGFRGCRSGVFVQSARWPRPDPSKPQRALWFYSFASNISTRGLAICSEMKAQGELDSFLNSATVSPRFKEERRRSHFQRSFERGDCPVGRRLVLRSAGNLCYSHSGVLS